MKKKITVLALATLSATTFAQTAEWLVSPQYSEIKYFGPKMYKVTKDGKVGIVGSDGKEILAPKYDAINLFYEGRAVFVNRTSHGWQVKGVLSEDGIVKYADEIYYLLPDYMFYSEGLLTVRDADGLYGYIDDECHPAFKFTADEVRPFSEGFAVVGSGETFHWVDASGEQVLLRLQMVELHLVVQTFMMEKLIFGMRMKNNLYWKPMEEWLKFLVENLWLIIYIDQILSLGWMYLMLSTNKIMANNGYRRNVMECGHICRLRESC